MLTPAGVGVMVQLRGRAMRHISSSSRSLAAAVGQGAVPLHACGDKLMMLGRGIKFQSKHTPRAAAVLLYLPESATGQPLTDPNLESALREAGHTVRAVTSPADLETALRTGTFDVVLANVTHAPELEKAKCRRRQRRRAPGDLPGCARIRRGKQATVQS